MRKITISPGAEVLPANVLRFDVDFPQPAEAHFNRERLWLLDDGSRPVPDAFLIFSQELWSRNGRRLTLLMKPRGIKQDIGASIEPALQVGREYTLTLSVSGEIASRAFFAAPPERRPLEEQNWKLIPPVLGSSLPLLLHFDRVMDSASCQSEITLERGSGEPVCSSGLLREQGRVFEIIPDSLWETGQYLLSFSERLEDVCGNRLGEALDHVQGSASRRHAVLAFAPQTAVLAFAPQTMEAV